MPNLLTTSPTLFLPIVVAVAMISLITTQLKDIQKWSPLPPLPNWRIFRFIRSRVTPLRLAHLAIMGYATVPLLSLTYLLTNGLPEWFDDTVVWLLLVLHMLVIVWAIYQASVKIEPLMQPRRLSVS